MFEKQGILGFMLENIRRELNNAQNQAHMDVMVNNTPITCGNHS